MLPTLEELFENRDIKSKTAIINFIKYNDKNCLNVDVLQELDDLIKNELNSSYKVKLSLLYEIIKSKIISKDKSDDIEYRQGSFDTKITKETKIKLYY